MKTTDSAAGAAGSNAARTHDPAARPGGRRARNWLAWAVIVAAFLLFVSPWNPPTPAVLASTLARAAPKSLGTIVEPATQLVVATVWRLVLVAVIGGAVPWAIGASRASWWTQASVVASLCALPTMIHWPSTLRLQTLPITVGLGLWAWWSTRLASTSLIWTLAWLGASATAVATGLMLLVGALFDDTPRITAVPPITKADRTRLEKMMRIAGDQEDENAELQFTASDLTGIAAAWLASRSSDTLVTFSGDTESLRCQMTQPIVGRDARSYLNVDVEMQPRIAADRIDPGLTALRVGGVRFPGAVVGHVSSATRDLVARTPQAARMLDAISDLTYADGKLRIVADPDRASSAFASSMATSPAASDRLRVDVREIMQALVDECASLPVGDERFFGLLRAAFRIAERRSKGQDAVEQNRAALVALAIQIGDLRMRRFAGFPLQEKMTMFEYYFDHQTTLNGRNDLARHFLVSAALRALSTRDIGMTMGLFKEQLDAVDGGSGFSFTDIAADMAGLRFADNVLDPARAARMQRRIQEESSVETVLPSFEGLSDGLSESMFKRLYGSLTDERYRMVIFVIEHRLEASPLLKNERTAGQD